MAVAQRQRAPRAPVIEVKKLASKTTATVGKTFATALASLPPNKCTLLESMFSMTDQTTTADHSTPSNGRDRLDFLHTLAKSGVGLDGILRRCPNASPAELQMWMESNGYRIETPEDKCSVCDRPQTWFRLKLHDGMCRKCERITNDIAKTQVW